MIKADGIKRLTTCMMGLLICLLCNQSISNVTAQRRATSDQPWQELVSTEGKFRVLVPDAPSEMSMPGPSQGAGGAQLFFVKNSVAIYAIMFGDLTKADDDPDLMKAVLDNTGAFLQASGKLRVLGEKNISSPGVQARQFILDDGAFVTTARVYYTKGRLYQVLFSRPGLSGTSSDALVQFYDGLSGKFFNSFKIGS
jgi:hypothetical protein